MEGPTAHEQVPALMGVRALVVEDDTLILMDLQALLEDAGAEIVGLCRSVQEALPLVEAGRVDVAILDFGLGDGTVDELAGSLKANGVPFCLYTGQVITDPRLRAWRDYKIIQKPAQSRTLVAAFAEVIAARGQARS